MFQITLPLTVQGPEIVMWSYFFESEAMKRSLWVGILPL